MAIAPERDTLRKECPVINLALANLTDLQLLGNYLISYKFLTGHTVSGILQLNESNYTKASKLMAVVDTTITISKDQKTITDRFNQFLLMLYEELDLQDLAHKLADRNREISAERSIVYKSPLPTSYLAAATTDSSSSQSATSNSAQAEPQLQLVEDDGDLTLAEIYRAVGIKESALQERVTENGLRHVARLIKPLDWGTYATALNISDNSLSDIEVDVQRAQEQRYQGLLKWKRKVAFRAIYLKLVTVFFENENAELAEEVCKLVRDGKHK